MLWMWWRVESRSALLLCSLCAHCSGRTTPLRHAPGSLVGGCIFYGDVGPLMLLCCSIQRWDMRTKTRVFHFQAHEDMVTVMLRPPSNAYTLTASHGGAITTWTPDWTRRLCSMDGPDRSLWHHAALASSGTSATLCGQGDGAALCVVVCNADGTDLRLLAQRSGEYLFAQWISDSLVVGAIRPTENGPVELHLLDARDLTVIQVLQVRDLPSIAAVLISFEHKQSIFNSIRNLITYTL